MNARDTLDRAILVPARNRRLWGIGTFLLVLTALFSPYLVPLLTYAASSDLHSHILLVPLVSAYLIKIRWHTLPREYVTSPGPAAGALLLGGGAFVGGLLNEDASSSAVSSEVMALMALSFVCCVAAAGFLLLGSPWMVGAGFPVAFLVFLAPLPDGWVHELETLLMHASADAAALFFSFTGVPILHDGLLIHLPGITLQVAQECSGIRSSWVLFITSLVVSNLFLQTPWRRILLLGFVVPLAILRNGFRILVIGWLCVNVGPEMISSMVHKRGGPLFFGLSLIFLFGLLWLLRRGERTPVEISSSIPWRRPERRSLRRSGG